MKFDIKTSLRRYYQQDLRQTITTLSPISTNVIIGSPINVKFPNIKASYSINLINIIGQIEDIQSYLSRLSKKCKDDTRIIITYYNYLWEPILKLAEALGLKQKQTDLNWLALDDIKNLLTLSNFETIHTGQRFLVPVDIPFVSYLINHYLAKAPLLDRLCLTNYVVARPINKDTKITLTVSILVPARNESGNIQNILNRLPNLGKKMEVIFIEGHSKDSTWEVIQSLKSKYKKYKVKAYKQDGIGKANAVHTGMKYATGDLIMILDADLSVPPEDLLKFYTAISENKGEFVNGSRLVYPLENQAMRFLNILGNKLFGILFSWTLSQRFTDTLCGTKVFYRKDYAKIMKLRLFFGNFDPFGDFELIFGAVKLNLKVVEIPIRYKARVYGKTNISRFRHGWLLIRMWFKAVKIFRLD